MLTRLEVDGFKNLQHVAVEFGPFTCIAGENGVGKSNVFDAIHFVSLIADRPLMQAAQEVRSTSDDRTGDPRDLFQDGHGLAAPQIRLAVEMVVAASAEDDFGQRVTPKTTFLRYEMIIGLQPGEGFANAPQIALMSESLTHITQGDAPKHLRFPHATKDWRRHVVKGFRRGGAFISTDADGGHITVHQDGGSRGQPFKAAAVGRSGRTVVSTQQAEQPTILAARREMQSWSRLALEPTALRSADSFMDSTRIASDGRHLAATLFRIAHLGADPAEDVYARVASRLNYLSELRVRRLWVEKDERREMLTLWVEDNRGISLPTRSLSEGTLRYLALCTLLEDPESTGLICTEEPENGIHPLNLPAITDLLRDLAIDPLQPPSTDNPLRQVIVNTHSPHVVQLMDEADLLYADLGSPSGQSSTSLRLRPIKGTWRDSRNGEVPPATRADLLAYLTIPPEAQFVLPYETSKPA